MSLAEPGKNLGSQIRGEAAQEPRPGVRSQSGGRHLSPLPTREKRTLLNGQIGKMKPPLARKALAPDRSGKSRRRDLPRPKTAVLPVFMRSEEPRQGKRADPERSKLLTG